MIPPTGTTPTPRIPVAVACLIAPGLPAFARLWIRRSTQDSIARSVAALPRRDAAIVPGCLPLPDGTPSPMLADRLATGLDLYRRRLVSRILISGNTNHPRGDEAATMRRWLLDHAVPKRDLLVDGDSRRTRDTMQRAAQVYGLRAVTVCTQRFHLPRALYLAHHASLDALGLEADRRPYDAPRIESLRELLAQTAAFVEEAGVTPWGHATRGCLYRRVFADRKK